MAKRITISINFFSIIIGLFLIFGLSTYNAAACEDPDACNYDGDESTSCNYVSCWNGACVANAEDCPIDPDICQPDPNDPDSCKLFYCSACSTGHSDCITASRQPDDKNHGYSCIADDSLCNIISYCPDDPFSGMTPNYDACMASRPDCGSCQSDPLACASEVKYCPDPVTDPPTTTNKDACEASKQPNDTCVPDISACGGSGGCAWKITGTADYDTKHYNVELTLVASANVAECTQPDPADYDAIFQTFLDPNIPDAYVSGGVVLVLFTATEIPDCPAGEAFCTNDNECRPIGTCSVDAECGTGVNSCNLGGAGNFNTNGTDYMWDCYGAFGGSDDLNCSAVMCDPMTDPTCVSTNGVCGSARGSCVAGVPTVPVDLVDGSSEWTCLGVNGGSDSLTCSNGMPVDGQCGSETTHCTQGDYQNSVLDPNGTHSWDCKGINGGNDDDGCSSITGICGSILNSCFSLGGVVPIDSTNWVCSGTNGGADDSCSSSSIVAGICRQPPHLSTINAVTAASLNDSAACSYGIFNNYNPLAVGLYTWDCQGDISTPPTNCRAYKQGACFSANPPISGEDGPVSLSKLEVIPPLVPNSGDCVIKWDKAFASYLSDPVLGTHCRLYDQDGVVRNGGSPVEFNFCPLQSGYTDSNVMKDKQYVLRCWDGPEASATNIAFATSTCRVNIKQSEFN